MALGVTAYSEAPFSAEPSNVIAYPSGIELTVQENSGIVNIDVDVSVTGTSLVSAVGTATAFSLVEVQATGQALTSNLGTVTEVPLGQQVDLIGFDLIANVANSTHDTLTAFGEAPFATLSPATFNIPVGIEATVGGIVGTFPLPMSLGNVTEITGDALVPLTGFDLTMQENDVSIEANVVVSITGEPLTITQGTAQGFTDVTTEDVTGIAMTMAQGSVAITGNADLTLSGFDLTMQENTPTVTGDANISITGQAMTATLNSIVVDLNQQVDVTGFDLTMQEGTATAPDSLAILTGIEMTMAEGSIQNIIWNPVDTGNAPIDPPGWKEVA
jgi:hypothetical protein